MNFVESINPLIAYISGFITFFASCLLPLIPTYFAFLTGATIEPGEKYERWKTLRLAAFFVLGFVITFIFIGATLNRFSVVLIPYRLVLEKIGGVLFVLFGLVLLESKFFQREFRLPIPLSHPGHRNWQAILFGFFFALSWTPCIGPVLAVILLWSSRQETLQQGLLLLTSFGIGLGTPFLLTALFFERLFPVFQRSRKVSQHLRKISGVIVLVSGILMLVGLFQPLSMWLTGLLGLQQLTP